MKPYPLYPHPALKDFRQLLDWRAGETPDNIAFQYKDKSRLVSVTYSQFRVEVDTLAAFFHAQGFQNAKIAVLGENSYPWILTYFAAVLSGNIIVPIDKELQTEDMISLLQRCGAKVLVYSPSYGDVAQAAQTAGIVKAAFSMAELPAMLENQQDLAPAILDGSAVCAIIYTSGTTGDPKGVMLTQKSLMTDTVAACQNVYIAGGSLLTLPLHHTFAFTTSVLAMLVYGVPISINKSLRTFQADMRTYKPQNMFLVPLYVETLYKGIWKVAREQNKERLLRVLIKASNLLRKCGLDLRRKLFRSVLEQFGGKLDLIVCGGAFLEQRYIDGMEDIGIQVLNGYGITECSPVVAVNRNRWAKPGSIGLPLPCCEVQIRDGEICVKGSLVMAGYFQNETATAAAVQDGWFHTGDLGYLDEDGFLFITGRKKNLIILSNGKNVSAEELESQILQIAGAEEAVVYEEDGHITAEIFSGTPNGIQEEIMVLNQKLPPYKRIQRVKFRETPFEKTTTRKIKRGNKSNGAGIQ